MQNCYYMHTRRKPSHFNYSIVYPLFFSVWLFKFYWFELRFCWNIAVDSYRKIDIIVSNVELIWRNNTVDLPRENIKSNPQKYYINTNWYSCACVCVCQWCLYTQRFRQNLTSLHDWNFKHWLWSCIFCIICGVCVHFPFFFADVSDLVFFMFNTNSSQPHTVKSKIRYYFKN